jgi:Rps23 Pro-64 3,4-dihydroxylase Tpa1-like proline 4-hydroxylase
MNNSIETDTYVLINKTSLSKPLCNEIIERFERQENKRDGSIFSGVKKDIKDTTDFHLCEDSENWKDIDKVLSNELSKALEEYILRLNKKTQVFGYSSISDKGFQIQKYEKGVGKYVFHNDFIHNQQEARILTYLWYLNTIEEGGQTDFLDRGIVKAEQGKLILFPACWTYPHAGVMPVSDNKYIITGWVVVPNSL